MPAQVESIGKASEGDKSEAQTAGARWSERLRALRRIPPIFRMVWNCAPQVVFMSAIARVIVSVIPVALLKVTQIIIDAINGHLSHDTALPHYFWALVGIEFALASAVAMLGRVTDILRHRIGRQVHAPHQHQHHGARVAA